MSRNYITRDIINRVLLFIRDSKNDQSDPICWLKALETHLGEEDWAYLQVQSMSELQDNVTLREFLDVFLKRVQEAVRDGS